MATKAFQVDNREMGELEKDLATFTKGAGPIAIRQTLNDTAKAARPIAQAHIREEMITRNKFTENRVIYQYGPRTLDVDRMESTIGHTEEYMRDQEYGGYTDRSGKYQTVIPTHHASNEPESNTPRRRAVVAGRRLRKIAFDSRKVAAPRQQGGRWMSKRQKAYVAGIMAVEAGKKYFILHLQGSRYDAAIYRIVSKRKGKPNRTEAVYYFRTGKTLVRKTRWLEESASKTTHLIADFYRDNLNEQARRNGLGFRAK